MLQSYDISHTFICNIYIYIYIYITYTLYINIYGSQKINVIKIQRAEIKFLQNMNLCNTIYRTKY